MRIWHQSFTDLTRVPIYGETLAAHAAQVSRPDTKVVIHGLKPDTYGADYAPLDAIKYRYLESLNELQICDAALAAEDAGYDAVALGCFFDPGLQAARSLVDIPVVSLAETCMLVACSIAAKFSIVTMSTEESAVITQLADRYMLAVRLAGTVTIDPAIDEYDLELADQSGQTSEKSFDDACAEAAKQGAELIIPGDGVLNEFLFRRRHFTSQGLPVMDSIGVLFKYTEMMADLRAVTGLTASRKGSYMKPPAAMLTYARQFAGQVGTAEDQFSQIPTQLKQRAKGDVK